MLALVVVHGVFWSGLLSASAAYLTSLLPERRRAEGISYWGLSSVAAIAVAPPIAFWMMRARRLAVDLHFVRRPQRADGRDRVGTSTSDPSTAQLPLPLDAAAPAPIIEWRVLVLSLTLFLYSFGYGAITSFSAMYADAIGVTPKSLYLTVARGRDPVHATAVGHARRPHRLPSRVHALPGADRLRPGAARGRRDATRRWSRRRSFFGVGFGTAYPAFVAYVMRDVYAARRGAAFGAILAAFDTGIGTGSTTVGWLIQRFGFSTAFGVAAALSAISLPYFLVADRKLR